MSKPKGLKSHVTLYYVTMLLKQIYGNSIEDLWKFPCILCGLIIIEHLTFHNTNGISMQVSMHMSGLITTNILHFAVLMKDLWKFPCTYVDRL